MNIDPTSKTEKERQRKMRRVSAKIRDEVRRAVRCAQCGALAGEYCKAKNGAKRLKIHSVRFAAVQNGKAAERLIGRITAPTATNPQMTYSLEPAADVREVDQIRAKKPRRQINPSG